jgi:hypothetical protein
MDGLGATAISGIRQWSHSFILEWKSCPFQSIPVEDEENAGESWNGNPSTKPMLVEELRWFYETVKLKITIASLQHRNIDDYSNDHG